MRSKNNLSLLAILFLCSIIFSSCGNGSASHAKIKILPFKVKGLDTLITNSGLKYILVSKNPTGEIPAIGKQVKVNYTGYFTDGKIFDSSIQRGEPFPFKVGIGEVIKGWDEGILLLHVGEKARLIIPYELAYGVEGSGPIPPLATLIFDVELISIEK